MECMLFDSTYFLYCMFRAVVEKWIEALAEAGACAELVPILDKTNSTQGRKQASLGSFEELVNTSTGDEGNAVPPSGLVRRQRQDRKEHSHENQSSASKSRNVERRKSKSHRWISRTPLFYCSIIVADKRRS